MTCKLPILRFLLNEAFFLFTICSIVGMVHDIGLELISYYFQCVLKKNEKNVTDLDLRE